MRSLILSLLFLCPSIWAQESRREITTTVVSPNDSKPNSKEVPDVHVVPSQFERVVILRFKYDTELLSALEKAVKDNKIRNGVILNGFGSVRNWHVHQVSNRTLPSKNMFVKDPSAPADIVGMSGMILNGRLHPHITLASPDKAFAGHLEPGTNVFTFCVMTIGVLPDALDLGRMDDKSWR
jgi:uncharacterized protein